MKRSRFITIAGVFFGKDALKKFLSRGEMRLKTVYLIRHCKATGQAADAMLTGEGFDQAQELGEFFQDKEVKRIISSPYLRAIQSIEPLVQKLCIEIETDERLAERVLTDRPINDWMERLEESFSDSQMKLQGGESGEEATLRVLEVLNTINDEQITVLVSHGNLLALLLNHFKPNFGFEEWRQMSNPDVFLLRIGEDSVDVRRVWRNS